jgi:hypothetical protein
MTRYPLPSNYVTGNRRVLTAAFVPLYHLPHARLGPGTPASTHWSMYCLKSVRRCKNHQFEDSPAVPGLRLGRSILRRRMKEIKSGPPRLDLRNERRATSCWQG